MEKKSDRRKILKPFTDFNAYIHIPEIRMLIKRCAFHAGCFVPGRSKSQNRNSPPHQKGMVIKMKVNKVLIIMLTFAVLIVWVCTGCEYLKKNRPAFEAEYTELGIPSKANYSGKDLGLYISDMMLFNGKLYIGDGDYSENTGPVNVMVYDIASGKWESSGALPDEAVKRFVTVQDELVIPGTDPRDDWSYGGYYILRESGWETVRTIPGGIHNFDMAEYNGALFAALGVKAGEYPLAVSKNDGKTFTQVVMEKDGVPIDTTNGDFVRCYDFFILKNELYATYMFSPVSGEYLTYEIYKYNNEKGVFEFFSDALGGLSIDMSVGTEFILERVVFHDRMYAATGRLVFSDDMMNFKIMNFPSGEKIWDLCVVDDILYVLCSAENDGGGHTVSVWSKRADEADEYYRKVFWFDYDIPAVSFTTDGATFWFGMHNNVSQHEKNGTVLSVSLPEN